MHMITRRPATAPTMSYRELLTFRGRAARDATTQHHTHRASVEKARGEILRLAADGNADAIEALRQSDWFSESTTQRNRFTALESELRPPATDAEIIAAAREELARLAPESAPTSSPSRSHRGASSAASWKEAFAAAARIDHGRIIVDNIRS